MTLASDDRPLAGCRVLVADDKPEMRALYRARLERAGAEVVAANDGRAAVAEAATRQRRGRPFSVVLLDLVMPDGGVAAAVALRADGFEGGIVGMSAFLTPETSEYWLAAGCDAVVPKDAPNSLLIATVADACRRQKQCPDPVAA